MRKRAGKDKLIIKGGVGKQAMDELTSDDDDVYGYYQQSTDIPVEEQVYENQIDDHTDEDSQDEMIEDYKIRAKQRKEALLREQQESIDQQEQIITFTQQH